MSAGNLCAPTENLRGSSERPPSPASAYAKAFVIAALFFAAIYPTLGWMGFYNGTEKISVATALQTRRDGHWLIPLLDGRPRFVKPPLTAWATALSIDGQTLTNLASRDPEIRHAAFRSFEIESRIWPLVSCCLLLLSVFELGRVIGGSSFGLTCELACGSTALFLKFARLATSDVQLALWVSVANVFLAHAILCRRRWVGCVGAGIALGLALMSKGPVALVESVLPALAFLPFRGKGDAKPRSWVLPILVGLGLMLLIELPWYIYILHRLGNLWHAFRNEITGEDSPDRASPWYSYLGFAWLFLPWLPLLILGAIAAVQKWLADRRQAAAGARGLLFALFLFVIPLLVLSFFKDKRDRYVLPMVGPAAILAAAGVTHCLREIRRGNKGALIWRTLHYWTLFVLATVLPFGGAIGAFDQVDISQKPVFGPALALTTIAVCWLLLGIGFLLRNTRRPALAPITTAVMLVLQALFFWGYSKTDDGVSPVGPLAEDLWSAYPDACILNVNGSSALGTTELSIYFDRPFTPIRAEYALKLIPGPQPIIAVIKLPTGDPIAARAQVFGAFAGWRFIDRIIDDTHVWYVFLLPAKSAVAQPASAS